MYIRHIDHVQLAMPADQESEARAFYRDILGLPEKSKPTNLAKQGGVWSEQELYLCCAHIVERSILTIQDPELTAG